MFIINPDPYSLPSYRIGPFSTKDVAANTTLPFSKAIEIYFSKRFSNGNYIYTENGRKAIHLALSHYNLQKNDVVTILTTTNNFYISGCVTREIEKICFWSRKIEPATKIIFVNHEFGYPYSDLSSLRQYNLPIIEDCANSFFSSNRENTIGTVGDFVIYSFPKMFPIQVGGLLKINTTDFQGYNYQIDNDLNRYIKKVLSHYIHEEGTIKEKRISNYLYLEKLFLPFGLTSRFSFEDGVIPGVFMFKADNLAIDLPALKIHFYAHGIQCSVFYGERAFYIPCHHNLSKGDMDYFAAVMKAYLEKK